MGEAGKGCDGGTVRRNEVKVVERCERWRREVIS